MKKTIKNIALAVLCLFCTTGANAQNSALKAWDRMPDLLLNNIFNPRSGEKMSDFKGKLTVLNFWSTNCRASIELLRELSELEKSYTGKLKIVSIGKGDVTAIKKIVEEQGLSSRTFIAEDSVFTSLFPHYMYPEFVWIGPDQTILGVTGSQDVNTITINKILNGEEYSFIAPKADKMDFNSEIHLFSPTSNYSMKPLYHSVLSSYGDGLPGGMGKQLNSNTVRIYAINQGRLALYFLALKLPGYSWPLNRIEYQNVSAEKFKVGLSREERQAKQYCYELSLPEFFADRAHSFMLAELEKLFGTTAKLEKRVTPVLVLKAISGKLNLKTSGVNPSNNFSNGGMGRKSMVNSTLFVLGQYIESIPGGLPVIDETNFKGRADINISARSTDLISLNTALKPYGLMLAKEERPIDILVISSTEQTNTNRSETFNKN